MTGTTRQGNITGRRKQGADREGKEGWRAIKTHWMSGEEEKNTLEGKGVPAQKFKTT